MHLKCTVTFTGEFSLTFSELFRARVFNVSVPTASHAALLTRRLAAKITTTRLNGDLRALCFHDKFPFKRSPLIAPFTFWHHKTKKKVPWQFQREVDIFRWQHHHYCQPLFRYSLRREKKTHASTWAPCPSWCHVTGIVTFFFFLTFSINSIPKWATA